MDVRRRISWISVGVAPALGGPRSNDGPGAKSKPRRGLCRPTPRQDAKDLKAVLFNWMWGTGMLKGHDERDMVALLEYQARGTIQVDGQPRSPNSVQHELPDLQPADSAPARGQTTGIKYRSRRGRTPERRHRRSGDRSTQERPRRCRRPCRTG